VALGIGPADHSFGDHLLGDKRGGLLEVLRRRQLLGQLPWQLLVSPQAVGPFGVLRSHPGLDEDPGVATNTHLESPYPDQSLG
jgi:hypothetical protein